MKIHNTRTLIASALLLASTSAFSVGDDSLRTRVECVDGVKFLIVWSTYSNSSPSVTQMLNWDGKPKVCGSVRPNTNSYERVLGAKD